MHYFIFLWSKFIFLIRKLFLNKDFILLFNFDSPSSKTPENPFLSRNNKGKKMALKRILALKRVL